MSVFGVVFAQLALGVLGVLVTAGEYSTGMIRSTLAAVPKRLPVLWSKAGLYGLISLGVGTVAVGATFLINSGILSGTHAAQSLGTEGVLRSLLGAGVYLGLVGVIGAALGSVLRSVAGGIAVLVGGFLLLPTMIMLLPSSIQDAIGPYLPSSAGEAMYSLHQGTSTLSPAAGFGVLLAWTAAALGTAAYRLKRKDV
jgi:ABC-2 type transport system permease protein